MSPEKKPVAATVAKVTQTITKQTKAAADALREALPRSLRSIGLKGQMYALSAVVVAMVAYLGISTFLNAREETGRAERLGLSTTVAGHLNTAAAHEALERGVGAAIIEARKGGKEPSAALTQRFADAGQKGDAELAEAQRVAAEMLESYPNASSSRRLEEAKQAQERLKGARTAVLAGSLETATWVNDIATANVNAQMRLRNAVLFPTDGASRARYYNVVLRAQASALAEFAGRERAALAAAIGSGKPISEAQLDTLHQYRFLVEQSATQMMEMKELEGIDPSLKDALAEFEKGFNGDFEQARQAVYGASLKAASEGAATVTYPLSADDWMAKATAGIESALAVSNACGVVGSREAAAFSSAATWRFWFSIAALVLTLGVFGGLFFWFNRTVLRPVFGSVAVLEAVATGDMRTKLSFDSRDEMGRLSRALNTTVESMGTALKRIADSAHVLASSSQELTQVSTEMSANAGKTREQTGSVAASSEQVSASMATVATAVEEMSTSIKEIAKH
ncbi:MAG: methyl-accepting chemotaxis protein, partial [Planctomycetes bacterium]|nr:methyl-accepting chemotaxis protein [Planctomycetota bacterium]